MTLQTIYPPLRKYVNGTPSVFLAGSIEMGQAADWQALLIAQFHPEFDDVAFYNPRRSDWDSSWSQDPNSEPFNNQVNWELDMLDRADFVFFHFAGDTKAPISLLELGMQANTFNSHERVIVSVDDAYWRKGNIEIVCQRAGIQCTPWEDALRLLKLRLSKWRQQPIVRPLAQSRC